MVEFCRLSLPSQKYKHYHQHSRTSNIKAPKGICAWPFWLFKTCNCAIHLLTEGIFLLQKCLIVILLGQQEASTRIPMKVSSRSAFVLLNIKYESVLG